MRALIYCRVSTVEQTQNLSLETQAKACRDYCARNGYDVDETFIDAGESAKTTDRPEFQRLLERTRRAPAVHAVIVYSLTRFSRNSADHHVIAGLLRGRGIALRSVTEPIDDSPSGKLMEGILAAMAQFDNDVRSERVTAGMKAAVDRGRWVWAAPIGYLNANARAGASLIPDPATAPHVQAAFTLCADGVTGRRLIRQLTAIGLRTKRGRPMSQSRLYELLNHPVYAGEIRSTAFGADVRGDFEPLVSRELFDLVQVRLGRSRAAAPRRLHRDHPDFPLRRFVRCETCGGALTGSWSTGRGRKKYGFYHCRSGCQRVPREKLETAFLELLDTLRPDPDYVNMLRAVVLQSWRETRSEATAIAQRAGRRIDECQAKLARLEDAFIFERRIDPETYQRQRDDLRQAVANARLEANEARAQEVDVESLLDLAERVLTHASALWTSAASAEEKIKIQSTLFPDGVTWNGERVGTGLTVLPFYQLDIVRGEMVDHHPPSWNPLLARLQQIAALSPAA